jgi:sulfate permease, SulP family
MGALGRLAPGLATLLGYRASWLLPDLVAGVTVWAVLVPQGLGYASLAGMPTVVGLYAALAAMLLYWLWGSSRELNVGPESTVAIMVATVLTPMAATGTEEYASLAAMLAILVGLVLIIGGFLRLGWIAELLSRPVLAGYVFGSGLLIIGSQLVDLFGLQGIDKALYAFDIGLIARNLDQMNGLSLAIGAGSIAVVLGLRLVDRRIPGALVAVIGGIALVAALGLQDRVAVVGSFSSGIPVPALPAVSLDVVLSLIGPAFAIALLVYPDSVLTARSLSTVGKYRLEPNREFFGIGAANVASGVMTGFPVNGSQSRSFVVQAGGARSQVANLWASGFVLLTLLLLAWVFAYLPSATLAGVVIVAGLGLLDVTDFRALYRYRRIEFLLAVFTAVAVVVVGMLAGIVIAVALSLGLLLQRSAAPSTAFLGRMPGTDTYRDLEDHPEAVPIPGMLLYRFDAPLFFANAGRLRDEILGAVDGADPPVEWVVLDMESIYDIDSTGAQTLNELLDGLDEQGVRLVFARVRTELRDELRSSGIERRIGPDRVYLEVDDAVGAYQPGRHDA